MRNLFVFSLGLFLIFISFACQAGTSASDPEPSLFSNLLNAYDEPFYPLEWAMINVSVWGDTRTGPAVTANVDLVFLVDESYSMVNSDPNDIRHSTIQDILNSLSPDQHRAAIVTFNNTAEILGGLNQLTNDFGQLVHLVDTIPDPISGALTNIAGAMQLANSLLINSSANHRIAILLTDGFPASENSGGYYDLDQDAEINITHVPDAITHDINYYVVHLDSGDWTVQGTTLLQNRIAGDTNGEYYVASDAWQLATQLPAIVENVSHTLILKDVVITTRFNMSPNEYSEIDEANIFHSGINTFQAFPSYVETEAVQTLPFGQMIIINIPITSYEPIPPGSPPDLTEIDLHSLAPDATVQYHLGDNQTITKVIPQVTVTWLRRPEILVLKRLNPGNREITISVTNFIRDGAIRDVRLWELLALDFEAVYPTAEPPPVYILPQDYKWGDIAWLYWNLGDIGPLETKEVKFDFRYQGPPTGNVQVDMTKPAALVRLIDPNDITREISTADTHPDNRWYGDNVIDASELNASPADSIGPDLIIYSSHQSIEPSASTPPIPSPSSKSIWNDAFSIDGYNQNEIFAYLANPEPLDLAGENGLWIRIDNIGNRIADEEIIANIYIKSDYTASPMDLDLNEWHHIGSVDFGPEAIDVRAFRVKMFEWDASQTLSSALINDITNTGQAFFKVIVSNMEDELRLNNNTAVVKIDINP